VYLPLYDANFMSSIFEMLYDGSVNSGAFFYNTTENRIHYVDKPYPELTTDFFCDTIGNNYVPRTAQLEFFYGQWLVGYFATNPDESLGKSETDQGFQLLKNNVPLPL